MKSKLWTAEGNNLNNAHLAELLECVVMLMGNSRIREAIVDSGENSVLTDVFKDTEQAIDKVVGYELFIPKWQ